MSLKTLLVPISSIVFAVLSILHTATIQDPGHNDQSRGGQFRGGNQRRGGDQCRVGDQRTMLKKKTKFSSYIRKFRWDRVQSHTVYMRK
jgi:hypothetical protein